MSKHLLKTEAEISKLLSGVARVAVLGIKTEAHEGQPAFYVPRYLKEAGLEVIPVPVYYPEVTHILGAQVYRRVQDIPGEIDLLDVFRRPSDIPAHLPDILAKKPRAVWFQLGIIHDEAAATLAAAGIDVVQNKCLMVEHRRWRANREFG